MLNKIWIIMIVSGFFVSTVCGHAQEATNAFISGAKEAVDLFLVLMGSVAMWCGFMKIAEKSGLVDSMAEKIMPLLKFLFPAVPKKSRAMKYIALNMAANFFGLGWAATPSGIMAVKELYEMEGRKSYAANSICMFMVINMSSIQLISVNIISYRLKYGSVDPAAIVLPGIIATSVSTITAVAACKIFERGKI